MLIISQGVLPVHGLQFWLHLISQVQKVCEICLSIMSKLTYVYIYIHIYHIFVYFHLSIHLSIYLIIDLSVCEIPGSIEGRKKIQKPTSSAPFSPPDLKCHAVSERRS